MTKHKALFGLLVACTVGMFTVAACGDDDDDTNPNTNGTGGKAGSGGSAGMTTGGSSGTAGSGGGGSTMTCQQKYDACVGDEKCAKGLECVLLCARVRDPDAVSKCVNAVGASLALVAPLSACQTQDQYCKSDCNTAAAGAGGGAGSAGASGAGGASGASGAAGASGEAGAAGEGGAGGASGGAGGSGGASGGAGGSAGGGVAPTCPPAEADYALVTVSTCGSGQKQPTACFDCFCSK